MNQISTRYKEYTLELSLRTADIRWSDRNSASSYSENISCRASELANGFLDKNCCGLLKPRNSSSPWSLPPSLSRSFRATWCVSKGSIPTVEFGSRYSSNTLVLSLSSSGASRMAPCRYRFGRQSVNDQADGRQLLPTSSSSLLSSWISRLWTTHTENGFIIRTL